MKTFPLWEPSASTIERNILEKFSAHQEELKKWVQSCEDLLVKRRVISSPANKNIVYTLEAAFHIIVAHERRHLNQAKELNEVRIKELKK